MSQRQLELCAVASVYHEPLREKQKGLCGLDRSMFEDKHLFEILEALMRAEFVNASELPDDVMALLMEKSLLSIFEGMLNDLQVLPALYRHYCAEIEKRSEEMNPPWI